MTESARRMFAEYVENIRGDVARSETPDDVASQLLGESVTYMEDFTCEEIEAHVAEVMPLLQEFGVTLTSDDIVDVVGSHLWCAGADTAYHLATLLYAQCPEQPLQYVCSEVMNELFEKCEECDPFVITEGTYEKAQQFATVAGIAVPNPSDKRVLRAIVMVIAREMKHSIPSDAADLLVSWCNALDISLVDFVTRAEPLCTDIVTAEDDVEPAAVAYVGDCIARKITRERMLAELDAAGLRNNRWIGEEALKKYGESVLKDHRNKLDGSSFVSVVQIFALTYPDALTSDTVRDCAQRNVEMGSMTNESDNRHLAPYGLSIEQLKAGMSQKSTKAYLPGETPILDQTAIDEAAELYAKGPYFSEWGE